MWEKKIPQRDWKYQTPVDILIKASNGASDFGNCFGQPLIVGSLLTFEHDENQELYSYDKVIMLAGGVGYGELKQSMKKSPKKGDIIVLLGGDNYRIGMGGASVSSTDTGSYNNAIELNAIQRSNPEMQKRVTNTIRSLFEMDENPIVSIHDHGAGGHLNCFSELVEDVGGEIYLDSLPIGDPSLSYKEIITGSENSLNIPILFQFRCSDKLGNVGGYRTNGALTNIKYSKKLGIDIYIKDDVPFSFDLKVNCQYKKVTSLDAPIIPASGLSSASF